MTAGASNPASGRGRLRSVVAFIALAVFCCGLVGWGAALGFRWENALEIIVRTFRLYLPGLDAFEHPRSNLVIRIGATLGTALSFAGVAAIWMAAAGRSLKDIHTRFLRRGHTLVVGETPLSSSIAARSSAQASGAVQVVSPSRRGERAPGRLHLLASPRDPGSLVSNAGLLRASHVVIDAGDDSSTMSVAQAVADRLADAPSPPGISMRIGDPLLADLAEQHCRAAMRGRGGDLVVFDEKAMLARQILARAPLFVRAAARRQARVHAVIAGFGQLGEELLDQVMLTSIAGDLGEPRITVFDKNAPVAARAFEARRPHVRESLAIRFLQVDVGGEPLWGRQVSQDVKAFQQAARQDPVTVFLVALPDAAEGLRAAFLLDKAAAVEKAFRAPVILARRYGAPQSEFSQNPVPAPDSDRGIFEMRFDEEMLLAAVRGSEQAHAIAKAIHEDYRRGPGVSKAGSVPWEQLPNSLRRAGLRAAVHLPAKLWTAGIDPGYLASGRAPTREAIAKLGAIIAGDTPDLERLARIEHDRWMIERKLDGWRFGKRRDDVHKLHPSLVPYDELAHLPDEIEKDFRQVRSLLALARSMNATG